MPSKIAIAGAGPAGLTAALLLAEAGHAVDVYEAAGAIGGLWASKLDADGFFRGDNSCKVYQPSYRTAPALLERIGTDWRAHFVPRHDLASAWLRPFVRDASWSDLRKLFGSWARHRLGDRADTRQSVGEFLEARGISEPCQAWMRATALGGIAGTTRMTMWELHHRLDANLDSVLLGKSAALYWSAQPPNAPTGFLTPFRAALLRLGVRVHLATPLRSVHRQAGTLRADAAGTSISPDSLVLAMPPRALTRLLAASDPDLAAQFGATDRLLAASFYEHLGITWFFDEELPRELPLGGYSVREGWHPILVQHSQHRPHLRPPAVTAVVGSVSLETDLRHPRLGTRARDHEPGELARILWDDQRAAAPDLPEPCDVDVYGLSDATQITSHGPLRVRAGDWPVFIGTNLHGLAPYFTASLEAAIQAGAIAAARVDPSVKPLPTPDRPAWPTLAS